MAETNFIDAESEFKSENTSFREIVMRHIERISKLSAMEYFHGGFYEQIPSGNTYIQKWIPDGKDVYCNAVQSLSDMLFSYFDETMSKAETDFIDSNEKNTADYKQCVKTKQEHNKDCAKLFKQERYHIHTRLFRNLCAFLHRKKFLEVGVMEE